MARRQPVQREIGSTLEMQQAFNTAPTAPMAVPGVQNANVPRQAPMTAELEFMGALAEFGSRKVREAAKTKYEKHVLDGQMAYQQGVAVDDLELDGNKWMLEGYRAMEAETVASALAAAQSAEISNGLYERDPDAFRATYTNRLEEALAGKDERTQDMIKERMAAQMPQLVEQHTREHAAHLENKNAEALATSVDVISRDPGNTRALVDFALGTSPASQGLSENKRLAAVVDGVERAFSNNNPMAYIILQEQGVFEDMPPEMVNRMRSASASYESRKRSELDEAFLAAEDALIKEIEVGSLTPEESLRKYVDLMAEHGMTTTAAEGSNVYGAARESNAHAERAIMYEVETAKLNGDYGKVADLTYEYAQASANPTTPGTVYTHGTTIDYQMGPKRPNKPKAEVVSVIGAATENVLGSGARVVISSGMEDEGEQHGSHRHGTGHAADVSFYRPDGSRVEIGDPEFPELAREAARLGAVGIGFGEEYMGSTMHVDLVGTKVVKGQQGGNVWASGAKAMADELVGIMKNATKGVALGDIDPQKWKTIVTQFGGDVEAAAVAYTMGGAAAKAWLEGGKKADILDPDVEAFVNRIGGRMSGAAYQTAETRAATAQATYEIAKERAAIQTYAMTEPALAALDDDFINGQITRDDYMQRRNDLRRTYDLALTTAEVDHVIATERAAIARATETVKEANDTDYAVAADQYAAESIIATAGLEEAVGAIKSMIKPEGMSDGDFAAMQGAAIQDALSTYQNYISTAATTLGIRPEDLNIADTTKQIVDATVKANNAAMEGRKINAEATRAVMAGTLNKASPEVQDNAWGRAQQDISAQVNAFANTPTKSGAQPSQDEVADFEKTLMEDWMAKSNFVPEQLRNEASSLLRGKFVQDDGTVSQHAIDTILAYRDLKAKSTTAANKMLDPDVRLIAEGVLDVAGNNERAIPRIMADLWAKGLNTPFLNKPNPMFAETGEVTDAIKSATGGGRISRMISRIVGSEDNVDTLGLGSAAFDDLTTLMKHQVQKLHELNPRLDPRMVTRTAEETVMRSVASLGNDQSGFLGGMSYYTGGRGNGQLLVDPTGGDLLEQTFGGLARVYEGDRSVIGTAINEYLNSPEFKSAYGDMTPSVSWGTWAVESLPLVSDDLSTAAANNKPMYSVQHVGEGKVMFDFVIDDEGTSIPLILPLSEIGEWYIKKDKTLLTK